MYLFTQYSALVGTLTLCCRRDKLVGLWIEGQKYFGGSHSGEMVPGDSIPVLTRTQDWLDRYFAGGRPDPGELPLAPEGSAFRQTVWALLLEIPYGQVITYGELARKTAERLGRASMSAQAVGGAVGHNPVSIVIPCHRLVGADGTLTGYAGGLDRKQWLLRHEGAGLFPLK